MGKQVNEQTKGQALDDQPCAFYWVNHGWYSAIVLYHGEKIKGRVRPESFTEEFRAATPEALYSELIEAGWIPEATADEIRVMCESAGASTWR